MRSAHYLGHAAAATPTPLVGCRQAFYSEAYAYPVTSASAVRDDGCPNYKRFVKVPLPYDPAQRKVVGMQRRLGEPVVCSTGDMLSHLFSLLGRCHRCLAPLKSCRNTRL